MWKPGIRLIEISRGKIYARGEGGALLKRTPIREKVDIYIEGPLMGEISVEREKLGEAVFHSLPSLCRLSERMEAPSTVRSFGKMFVRGGTRVQELMCRPLLEERVI